ncbi:MAG: hypothetical protein ABFD24_08215 [Anaerolineaceae bacterium]
MKHLPYESWILDETPLNEDQQRDLDAHLLTCPVCCNLRDSWQAVRQQIESAPQKQPSPGFSMRWKASLKDRREADEVRQRRLVWIWIASIAAAVLLSLAVIYLPRVSFIQVLISIVESLVGFTSGVSALVKLVTGVLHTVPPYMLVLSSIALSTLLSITIFLWGISIWRMSRKGVTHYEEN